MTQVKVEQAIEAGAEAVWALVRDFGEVDRWSAGISSCEVDGSGVGAVRTLRVGDMVIREKLESHDDEAREFQYSIVDAPLPIQRYLATFRVAPEGDGARITWISEFAHDGISEGDARALIEGTYRAGIRGICKALGIG